MEMRHTVIMWRESSRRNGRHGVVDGIKPIHPTAWKTDAGRYAFLICSSVNTVEVKASANVKAWSQKVHNVMKPNVKLNLLKR